MKKLLISFVLLFSLNVFAQDEMDTTLVVNANGDTIGLVHKKGEAPVIPTIVTQTPVKEEPIATESNDSYVDSIAKYQKIVDQYLVSGKKMQFAGNGLMVAGGIGTGLGVGLIVVGYVNAEKETVYSEIYSTESTELKGSWAVVYAVGVVLAATMPELLITGIVLKCVGSGKLRKAERMEQKVDKFKNLQNSLATLRVRPIVNPLSGAVGGDIAFNF